MLQYITIHMSCTVVHCITQHTTMDCKGTCSPCQQISSRSVEERLCLPFSPPLLDQATAVSSGKSGSLCSCPPPFLSAAGNRTLGERQQLRRALLLPFFSSTRRYTGERSLLGAPLCSLFLPLLPHWLGGRPISSQEGRIMGHVALRTSIERSKLQPPGCSAERQGRRAEERTNSRWRRESVYLRGGGG